MRRLVAALALGLAAGPAHAGTPSPLYQGHTIVTGTDMRSRPTGFADCLRDVLVKVSGDPTLLGDPRLDTLAAHAGDLVAGFGYVDHLTGQPHHDEQGSRDRPYDLTVRFDPARVRAALASLGRRPWTAPRPTLFPVILVDGFKPPYYLAADGPGGADQRTALAAAADRYALPLRLPASGGAAFRPPPGSVTVAGTLVFSDAAQGWIGSWQLAWHGRIHAWAVRGVSYDEAFRDLVRGAERVLSGQARPDGE